MMTAPTSSFRMQDPPAPDLRTLDRLEPVERRPGRNLSKADVLFYRLGDVGLAVKTYAARPFLIRHLLGRWQTAHECSAYRQAAGIPGLPRFFGRLSPYALATEWIEGRTLESLRDESVDEEVFDRLAAVLEDLHAHGLAHGDLHHRDVLLGDDGSVVLVDLSTAWWLGNDPGPLRRAGFERLRDLDRVALARLRARFTGGDEAAAIAAVGPRAAAWHRRGRRLKALLNRVRGKAGD